MQGALRSPPVGTRRPSARFAHVQILSQGDAARPREENFGPTSAKRGLPGLTTYLMYLFSPYTPISSDAVDCGTPYFPDCEPSWSTCQFCGAIHCIRCHDYDECLPGQVAKDPTAALGVCVQCVQSCEFNEGEEDSCLLGEGVRERLGQKLSWL